MSTAAKLIVSIVSHGHGDLVSALMEDLARYCGTPLRLILTLNVPEKLNPPPSRPGFEVQVVRNDAPKGFGANHNRAFRLSQGEFFCVLNPDIRVSNDPFPGLLEALTDQTVAVVAPRIVDAEGRPESSARKFPTPLSILLKSLGRSSCLDYPNRDAPLSVDWVAGMFMLFRGAAFARVRGFDERYFLYYEDADICRRLRRAGYEVRLEPRCEATHFARRTSHRNPRYLRWHLTSMLRFFVTR